MRPYLRKNWFWLAVNMAAALPLLFLLLDMATDNLSVNPIDDITDRTGKAAIILLMASLACTPANIVTGWRQPIQVRKALGLWAFAYAGLHFLNFVGNDYLFDVSLILRDGIVSKPFIIVGFAAFLMLVPLAITSTRGWMRRLGRKWKTLHKLVYVVGIAAIVHFLWLAKAAEDWEPMLYGAFIAVLLLVRVPPVRRQIVSTRRKISARFAPIKADSGRPSVSRQQAPPGAQAKAPPVQQ